MGERSKGQDLRRRILRYLLDRERQHGAALPELVEIAQALNEPEPDISDQIDILESQGAIRANRVLSGGASPMLTGIGKALLEELEERVSRPYKARTAHKARSGFQWDVFVCHASEDKETFVQGLAEELSKTVKVWYDDFTLDVGDSLRRSIDRGLKDSQYGIVVLSHQFFAKEWPQKELDGLVTRERNNEKVILPVWLGVGVEDVQQYSPLLADRVAIRAEAGIEKVVDRLLKVLSPER